MSTITPSPQLNTAPGTNSSSSTSLYLGNMDELKTVFNRFDANKDGKISVSELGDVLKTMGSSYSTEDLERVMEDIDTDKDGFISLSEFCTLCGSPSNAVAASELRDAFDLYDQDKNGLISSKELHLVLNQLGMKCSVDDCIRMIKSVDSDGDGNVNFEEFQKMMSTSIRPNDRSQP